MKTSQAVKIMLVDDHAIVREGYKALLEKQQNMMVVTEAGDSLEAYSRFKTYSPDVVIVDLSLPGQGGLEIVSRLREYSRDVKVLVFTMHQNPTFAIQATRAGARGYVTKDSEPDVLIRAINEVYAGRLFISANIAQQLAMQRLGNDSVALEKLTVREFEILRMLVEAQPTDDIAQILHISPKTVANCHYIIKRKLDVTNDIELTRLAIKMNVINLLDLSAFP